MVSRPDNPRTATGPEFSGVILAIDYGRKRLGLALCDEQGTLPRPFATWNRINRRRDLARLRDLVRRHAVRRIVVGLPLHLDGTPSEMSEEASAFAARVAKAIGISVELVDERLTSWEARQKTNRPSGPNHRKSHSRSGNMKPSLDDVAAALILQTYLNQTRPPAALPD